MNEHVFTMHLHSICHYFFSFSNEQPDQRTMKDQPPNPTPAMEQPDILPKQPPKENGHTTTTTPDVTINGTEAGNGNGSCTPEPEEKATFGDDTNLTIESDNKRQQEGSPFLNHSMNNEHVVHVHVNPGEMFSVRVGDQMQHIRGESQHI